MRTTPPAQTAPPTRPIRLTRLTRPTRLTHPGRLIGTVALLLLVLAGCGLTSPVGGRSQDADEPGGGIEPIGYSSVFLQDPAQAAMVRLFQEEADRRNLDTLSPTSANGDAAKQDTDIRNLVNAGARSIFVIPADPQAVVPAIEYATSRGVRVITLMLGPSGGRTSHSLEVDNREIGERACGYLADRVGEQGTVLQILGDLRASTAQDRRAGFDSCMASEHPDLTVVSKTGGRWEPAKAAESTAAALSTDPEIGGIFLHSDGYVPSVSQVLADNGALTPRDDPGHVWTVSVDGTPEALAAIRDGELDASFSQPIDRFVSQAMDDLRMLSDRGSIPVGETGHGTVVRRTDDGYTADLFAPVLADSENVDDPSHWANATR